MSPRSEHQDRKHDERNKQNRIEGQAPVQKIGNKRHAPLWKDGIQAANIRLDSVAAFGADRHAEPLAIFVPAFGAGPAVAVRAARGL